MCSLKRLRGALKRSVKLGEVQSPLICSQLDKRVKAVTVSGSYQEDDANPAAIDSMLLENPLGLWIYLYVDRKPEAPL